MIQRVEMEYQSGRIILVLQYMEIVLETLMVMEHQKLVLEAMVEHHLDGYSNGMVQSFNKSGMGNILLDSQSSKQ